MRSLFFVLLLLPVLAIADDPQSGSRLSSLLNVQDDAGFAKADRVRPFSFPADHGPHEAFRNEWWYVTGNLDGPDARRFGFEITIFRFSLTPTAPARDSKWRSNQVYIAHLAVTDAENDEFHMAERYARGALGLAGARAAPLRVWVEDWEIAAARDGDPWRIRAADGDIALDLTLSPLKPPVLNGDRGLSRKSSSIDSASYYYAITRLRTQGTITIANEALPVTGLSWLDREWSTSALAADQVGWDWFALQLSDGTDVMLYNLRKTDGSNDTASSGTITLADGSSTALRHGDFEIVINDEWESPAGGTYPSGWTIRIPGRGLTLDVEPVIDDQELFTTVRYWEGAVDVSGTDGGRSISGRGYVELTGYAE